MKLIDEVIEILEEYRSEPINPRNKAAREFINFSTKTADSKIPEPAGDIKPMLSEPIQNNKKDFVNTKQAPAHNIRSTATTFTSNSGAQNFEKAKPISQDISNMQMEQLRQFTLSCNKCTLCKGRNNVVFGEGNPNTEIMFIGEAPGRDEDLQGKPFVGKSGQLLTKMIKAMGYTRDDVYIANIIKCRPPYNRNPNPEEAKQCLDYLNRQIELIKPKVIVLLGGVALRFLLDLEGITRLRGQWLEYRGIKTIPTFHPAYLLRNENQKRAAWHDLQKVMKFLGKL